MKIAYRKQNDGLQDEYSIQTGLDCSIEGNKDMARQEFKDDADINNLLKRFGVENQQRTTIPFGEADYTIDLQQAMHSVSDAQRAYSRMDPAIKKLYPNFEKFLRGMNSGDLARDLERLETERRPAAQEAEIRQDLAKERRREQLLRDEEAERIARDFKEGKTSPKEDSKPK